ncbi:MAG: hypothetical protein JO142_21915 [Burkholderiales bacterium]|nr:hypothetical protein [Burkholderiales bacterium]
MNLQDIKKSLVAAEQGESAMQELDTALIDEVSGGNTKQPWWVEASWHMAF